MEQKFTKTEEMTLDAILTEICSLKERIHELKKEKKNRKTRGRPSINCLLGHPFEPSDWFPGRYDSYKTCRKCGKEVHCSYNPFSGW